MKSCQEITELMEKRAFKKLSLMERMELRMHRFICKHCKRFFKDSAKIDTLLNRTFRSKKYQFSKEEKEQMIDKLKNS